MSVFAVAMMDNVDKVYQFTDGHLGIFKETSTFYKKLFSLEEEFNRNVMKLCKTTADAYKASYQGSVVNHWEKTLMYMEALAKQRAELMVKANIIIADVSIAAKKDTEKNVQMGKLEGEKVTKNLQALHLIESKAKDKYQKSFEEWEASIIALEKEASGHRKSSAYNKLQEKVDSSQKKMSQSKAEYAAALNNLNETQRITYESTLPAALKRLEELNVNLGDTIVGSMKEMFAFQIEIAQLSLKTITELTQHNSKASIQNDIQDFCTVNANKNFFIPPPVKMLELEMSDSVKNAIESSKPTAPRENYEPSLGRRPSVNPTPTPPTTTAPPILSRPTSIAEKPITSIPGVPPLVLSPRAQRKPLESKKMAKALYDCIAEDPDELSFREGDIFEVLENQGQWWRAKDMNGNLGSIPSNYVELISTSANTTPTPSPPILFSRGVAASTSQPVQQPIQQTKAYDNRPLHVIIHPDTGKEISVHPSVPSLVRRCVDSLITKGGIKEEGIFRVPGSLKQMQDLKSRFEKEGDVDISDIKDAFTVAGTLKLYFREARNFPITKDFKEMIVEAWKSTDERTRTQSFITAMQSLEVANFQTLKILIELFVNVVQQEEHNKMNTNNMSRVFGLSLFPDFNTNLANGVLEFWIHHYEEIFSPSYPQYL